MTDAPNPPGSACAPDAGVDLERLRGERLARCFAVMERYALDVLVLGREANVRYVTDARRLWLAGARPFGPGCVVVRATREVHLLSTSSAGVPATIPTAQLYALTWNPEHLAARLERIHGLSEARTIGIDGWNPGAARLLARVAPRSRLADGDAALHEARRAKTRDEVACLRAAAEIARAGLAAARAQVGPTTSEPVLRGAFVARLAALAATTPSFESVVHPAVRAPLLALRSGVLHDGYEATLIRSYWSSRETEPSPAARDAGQRCAAVRDRLAEACRVGAGAGDLLAAYAAASEELPPFPVAHGVGLGCEPPLVGRDHVCDPRWRIAPGDVLALYAFAASGDATSCLTQDLVNVTATGVEVLTPEPYGLLAT